MKTRPPREIEGKASGSVRLTISMPSRMAEAMRKAAEEAQANPALYARVLLARVLREGGYLA